MQCETLQNGFRGKVGNITLSWKFLLFTVITFALHWLSSGEKGSLHIGRLSDFCERA